MPQCIGQVSITALDIGRGHWFLLDNISHPWLVANIPISKRILKQWSKAGYMERKTFRATEEETP